MEQKCSKAIAMAILIPIPSWLKQCCKNRVKTIRERKGQSDCFIEGIWVEILSFLSLTICIYLSLEGSFVFAVVTNTKKLKVLSF